MTSKQKGITALIISAFGFALMGVFVRLADSYGEYISSFQKSFFRNIVAGVMAGVMFAIEARKTPISIPKNGWGVLVLRSVLGTVGIFGHFYALSHIPLGDACMLNKLSPFATVLACAMFLGEKLHVRQVLAIVGAFLGAVFVIKPGFHYSQLGTLPALAGLIGGIGAGGAYACLRKLGILKMNASFIILFFSIFSTLATVPFLIFDYHPMTLMQVVILLAAGVSATMGQFGVTLAYRFAQSRDIAVYDYTNIIFGTMLGFIVFDQVPDLWSWLGIVLILFMGFVMHLHGRKSD